MPNTPRIARAGSTAELVLIPAAPTGDERAAELARLHGLDISDEARDLVAGFRTTRDEARARLGRELTEEGVQRAIADGVVGAGVKLGGIAHDLGEKLGTFIKKGIPAPSRSGDPSAPMATSEYVERFTSSAEQRAAVDRDLGALLDLVLRGSDAEGREVAADIRDRGDVLALQAVDGARSSVIRGRLLSRFGLDEKSLPGFRLATRVRWASTRGDGDVGRAIALADRFATNVGNVQRALLALADGAAHDRVSASVNAGLASLRSLVGTIGDAQPQQRGVRVAGRDGQLRAAD